MQTAPINSLPVSEFAVRVGYQGQLCPRRSGRKISLWQFRHLDRPVRSVGRRSQGLRAGGCRRNWAGSDEAAVRVPVMFGRTFEMFASGRPLSNAIGMRNVNRAISGIGSSRPEPDGYTAECTAADVRCGAAFRLRLLA
jgi:hypothetical protein